MIKAAITFFIIGLIAVAFGAYGMAGLSIEAGKTILYVFLGLSAISLLISLFSGGRPQFPS